jgi:hypothetical protein
VGPNGRCASLFASGCHGFSKASIDLAIVCFTGTHSTAQKMTGEELLPILGRYESEIVFVLLYCLMVSAFFDLTKRTWSDRAGGRIVHQDNARLRGHCSGGERVG